MSKALDKVSNRKVTDQRERTAGVNEVKNNAGGYVFSVGTWERVRRFLILGVDGGTYYVSENKLAKDNANVIAKAIAEDVRRLVDVVVEVSDKALAPKNSPAIFALAMALTDCKPEDKAYVRAAVPKVCRTATHLFEFAQYIENMGGWGRAKRGAIADWYEAKESEQVAYQAVKYRQRNGWTHRDLFRLAHPKGVDTRVGDFILGKSEIGASMLTGVDRTTQIVSGFKAMQEAQTVSEVCMLIETTNLPWEAIPTQFLKNEKVWKTLFYNGALGQTALLRNITRFAKIGAFKDIKFAGDVAAKLVDPEALRKGRIHPVQFLVAGQVYEQGRYVVDSPYGYGYGRFEMDWDNAAVITDALNDGFYAAFGSLEPANKRTLLALDVSGSMSSPCAGLQGVSCAKGAAAMAMVTARTEPYYEVRGFTAGAGGYYDRGRANLTDLGISPKQNLNTVMTKTSQRNFGATDCAQPMLWAMQEKVEIDTFVVYTDSETWAGTIKPVQALKQYRDKMGIAAKLVVVGMVATDFTIADPNDAGMMDVVGFDTSAPGVIANFSAGR